MHKGRTITGKGNYADTVKGSFVIKKEEVKETPKPISVTEPVVTQTPVIPEPPVTTEAPLAAAPVKAPSKPTLKKLTNKSAKKLIVSWKKLSDAEGYEVSVSTKKNFKKNTKVKNTSGASCTFTKLKKGKTYFVRVRAYNTDNGAKVYGKYSSIKKIKIKK